MNGHYREFGDKIHITWPEPRIFVAIEPLFYLFPAQLHNCIGFYKAPISLYQYPGHALSVRAQALLEHKISSSYPVADRQRGHYLYVCAEL